MLPNLFSHPVVLIQGLFTGLILGVLLQKSRLTQFQTAIDQFLLRDFTMLKILLTAIIVGSIGIYFLLGLGLPLRLAPKGGSILAVLIGGTLFGTGIAILGYAPSTCIAAIAQGSRDARWGILGMLLGAFLYAEMFGFFEKNVITVGKVTAETLPNLFNVSPWIIILVLTVVTTIVFKLIKKSPKIEKEK